MVVKSHSNFISFCAEVRCFEATHVELFNARLVALSGFSLKHQVFLFRIFSVTFCPHLHITQLNFSVFAGFGRRRTLIRGLKFSKAALSVVPIGETQAHTTVKVRRNRPQVISAVSFHHHLSSILCDASAQLPELRVIRGRHELSFHIEL